MAHGGVADHARESGQSRIVFFDVGVFCNVEMLGACTDHDGVTFGADEGEFF